MIRAVGNKRIDLSNDEYSYYLELEKIFGKESFIGLFKTNKMGIIDSVTPPHSNPVAMVIVFFFMNVMFNQRLRRFDTWMNKMESLESRIEMLEESN